jgi:hypothetical protein
MKDRQCNVQAKDDIRPNGGPKNTALGNQQYQFDNRRLVMVFNATLNKISVISWRLVLLVEKTGVTRENHRPAANH